MRTTCIYIYVVPYAPGILKAWRVRSPKFNDILQLSFEWLKPCVPFVVGQRVQCSASCITDRATTYWLPFEGLHCRCNAAHKTSKGNRSGRPRKTVFFLGSTNTCAYGTMWCDRRKKKRVSIWNLYLSNTHTHTHCVLLITKFLTLYAMQNTFFDTQFAIQHCFLYEKKNVFIRTESCVKLICLIPSLGIGITSFTIRQSFFAGHTLISLCQEIVDLIT